MEFYRPPVLLLDKKTGYVISFRFLRDVNSSLAAIWTGRGSNAYLEVIMYAIIRTGGKQYQVEAGKRLRVEKLDGNIGDSIVIDDVLMVSDGENIKIGQPVVDGAQVNAKIVEQDRAKKVLVFKKKKRKGYQVQKGHRQSFTGLEIQDIKA